MKTHSIVSFNRHDHTLVSGRVQRGPHTNQSGTINPHKQSRFAKWASLTIAVAAATTVLGQSPAAQAVEYDGPMKAVTMWDGMIYKVHRDPNSFKLIVRRAAVPKTPDGNTVWTVPPAGDFSNFGYFVDGEISRNSNVGALVSDYPVAQAAPLIVNTGPREGIDKSMTIMWLRWLGGDKYNAPNRSAWTALTVNKYTANDYESIAFDTYGTGADSARDVTAQNQAYNMYEGTPQVGAAALPGGEMVVTANPDRNKMRVNLNWWGFKNVQSWKKPGGRSGLTPLVEGIVAVKPPAGVTPDNWNGNVDLALTQDPSQTDSNFTLWMALRAGNSVWVGGMTKKTDNKVLTVAERQSFNNFTWHQIPFAANYTLRHSLMHVNASGQAVINIAVEGLGAPPHDTYVRQVRFPLSVDGAWSQPKPLSINVGKRAAPDVVTTFGAPPASTSADAEVVVSANDAYINAENDDAYQAIPFGKARRSKLLTVPNVNPGVLLGIIDGPPPVPNQNLVNAPSSLLEKPIVSVTYGDKATSNTRTTFGASAGPIIKTEGEAGVPLIGGVAFEGEVSALLGGEKTDESEVSKVKRFTQEGIPTNESGKTTTHITPRGQVVIAKMSIQGFGYQLLDLSGQPFTGANYIQLLPGNVQVVLKDFVYDTRRLAPGEKRIIPGELATYIVDQDSWNSLNANSGLVPKDAELASKAQNYIQSSWTSTGHSDEETAYMTKSSTTGTVDVDGQFLAGGTFGNPALGNSAKVKAGIKFKVKYETEVGDTKEETLGVDLTNIPYSDEPGAYSNYSFWTFKLQGDNKYQQDLQKILEYNDPTGTNADTKNSIAWDTSSAPWKITYAILEGFSHTNSGGEEAEAASSGRTTNALKAPKAFIPVSLQKLGITDDAKVGLLSSAVMQMEFNKRIGLKASRPVQGVPANITQIANKLTPAERTDLKNYNAQGQAQAFRDLLKKYPNWKPRDIVVGTSQPSSMARSTMSTRAVKSTARTIPAISVDKFLKATP